MLYACGTERQKEGAPWVGSLYCLLELHRATCFAANLKVSRRRKELLLLLVLHPKQSKNLDCSFGGDGGGASQIVFFGGHFQDHPALHFPISIAKGKGTTAHTFGSIVQPVKDEEREL